MFLFIYQFDDIHDKKTRDEGDLITFFKAKDGFDLDLFNHYYYCNITGYWNSSL